MMKINQQGYILLESLVGLTILSVVTLSLIQVLPLLIETKETLEIERTIYNTLYEISDQQKFYGRIYPDRVSFSYPISYTITPNEFPICATFIWRNQNEKKICF